MPERREYAPVILGAGINGWRAERPRVLRRPLPTQSGRAVTETREAIVAVGKNLERRLAP